MAKLEFQSEQIQNTIIPNLKDSISSLSPALNLMDSTVIPGNFKYKTQLLQIKSDISNAKNSLIDEQDHLTNSINIITNSHIYKLIRFFILNKNGSFNESFFSLEKHS